MDMESTSAHKSPIYWDPYDIALFKNPYSVYRRLREEVPVYYNEKYDFYAVSHYDDVQRVLGDRDTFISGRGVVLEIMKEDVAIPDGLFIFHDQPRHLMYRALLTKVFTPRRVAALEPQIRSFCAQALDHLVEGGEFDFVRDLGLEMPMRVIGMLLGIPDEDLKAVQQRSRERGSAEPGKPKTGHYLQGEGFGEYLDWRATHPSDDVMTELMQLQFADDKGNTRTLRRDEIETIVMVVATGGFDTTSRLIGWTGKLLAENPDQRRQIHENRGLIQQTIEEILRYEPSTQYIGRTLAQDAEFHGVKIPKGSAILSLIGAANRDEAKFKNGEQFNINRERVGHVTFGFGVHACLGNMLARMEGRIALDEVLNRFPEWDVDLSNSDFAPTPAVRGWETVPAYTPKSKRGARA
jgi:cytochrome P450